MATATKQHAPRRGDGRRCGWYSSCAFALGGGLMPSFETKPQSLASRLVDVNAIGARAAGPPG